jgi:azurin
MECIDCRYCGLEKSSLDVSGEVLVMDMVDSVDRVFVADVDLEGDKELVFARSSRLIRATTLLTIGATPRNITLPANTMVDTSKWTWSKPSTKFIWTAGAGTYELRWVSKGAYLWLEIVGNYSLTLL